MLPDKNCYNFIEAKEALRLAAYQDSAGVWTIGYGTIEYPTGDPVKKGDVITGEYAKLCLIYEVDKKAAAVNACLQGTAITQNQYNALVSFAYNAGSSALRGSTLLKLVRANPNDPNIRKAFMMWNKAHIDGVLTIVKGLVNRRTVESDLYFS